jgi:hypothetical protein
VTVENVPQRVDNLGVQQNARQYPSACWAFSLVGENCEIEIALPGVFLDLVIELIDHIFQSLNNVGNHRSDSLEWFGFMFSFLSC